MWEYLILTRYELTRTERGSDKDEQASLNELGKNGWELVTVESGRFYLKHRKGGGD
jgi:hypothetical protein